MSLAAVWKIWDSVSIKKICRLSNKSDKRDMVTSRLNESDWMMRRLPQGNEEDDEVTFHCLLLFDKTLVTKVNVCHR